MDMDDDAAAKRAFLEKLKAGDKHAQALVFAAEHGDEAGELFLRAADGDPEAQIRFLARYSEEYRMADEECERFLKATHLAEEGDLDAIRVTLEIAGVRDVEASMGRVRSGDHYFYLILLESLESDDAIKRTVARRSLERRGWDEQAYAELSGKRGDA